MPLSSHLQNCSTSTQSCRAVRDRGTRRFRLSSNLTQHLSVRRLFPFRHRDPFPRSGSLTQFPLSDSNPPCVLTREINVLKLRGTVLGSEGVGGKRKGNGIPFFFPPTPSLRPDRPTTGAMRYPTISATQCSRSLESEVGSGERRR